jgi:hypothetical protein
MLRKHLHNILLNADISPDGVVGSGGGNSTSKPVVNPPASSGDTSSASPADKVDDKATTASDNKSAEDKSSSKDASVSIDDFANLDSSLTQKPNVKLDDKPADKPADKIDTKPVADKVDKTTGRDYSGIADEHVPAFKKMSNEAFAAMKPIYLERQKSTETIKQLNEELTKAKSNALPDSYYENEMGFILDPEYQQAATNLEKADYILRHWREQMRLVQEGKDWADLEMDDKGQFKKSAGKGSDSAAVVEVQEAFNHALQQYNRVLGKTQGIQQSFVARSKQAINTIKESEDAWFPALKDEKHPLQPVVKLVREKLPPQLRNNPLAGPLAKALVALQVMKKDLEETEKKVASAASSNVKPTAPQVKAGPTAGDIQGGASSGKTVEDISINDFQKLEAGY